MTTISILLRLSTLIAAGIVTASAIGRENACGEVTNAYGPFDYRTATKAQKALVEGPHFPPHVELLQRGATNENLGHDIDFTLRAFPNHHRALLAMSKLSLRVGRGKPVGANYTIACYFDRAIRFQPDDPMPYVIAGLYFGNRGLREEAMQHLDRGRALANDDPNLHYNLGLGYLNLKEYEKSLEHAQRAYRAGFPLPGLRDRLREAGVWKD